MVLDRCQGRKAVKHADCLSCTTCSNFSHILILGHRLYHSMSVQLLISALLYCCHAYHVTKLSTRILPWLAAKTDEVETLQHELITWIVSAMKPTSLAGLVGTFPHNCGGQALRQEYCHQYASYMGLDPDAIIETQRKSHQYTSWLNAYNR